MDKHPQAADDEVNEVVEELKVQHHGLVSACEGSSVPHKTCQEYDFIAHLEYKVSLSLIMRIQDNEILFILILKNERGLGRGLWVRHWKTATFTQNEDTWSVFTCA